MSRKRFAYLILAITLMLGIYALPSPAGIEHGGELLELSKAGKPSLLPSPGFLSYSSFRSSASALALILGAVGLYGVLCYRVTRRTQEIGVRMALGAEARAVCRMVVVQGGQVALLGVAFGVLAALGLTRFIESLLYGVRPVDAITFAVMAGVMLAVALLASYIPARRASRVDPALSLRAE